MARFEADYRPWAGRILVIDDLDDRPHDCDVLLDQSPGRRGYLREWLAVGGGLAIGYPAPKEEASSLVVVPPIPDAKFGEKQSAIGHDSIEFVDLRVIHA